MKKLFLLLVAGAMVLGLSLPAVAAIDNTAHDISYGTGGTCAVCHLPHGASSNRLWVPFATGSLVNLRGPVAQLCGYCHQAGVGIGGAITAGIVDPTSTTWVYSQLSHGWWMSNTSAPRSFAASGLPYHANATDYKIDCTTCHDVHNDTRRPFLRANINVLCSGCHSRRMMGAAAPALDLGGGTTLALAAARNWGAYVGSSNPGSHPVGPDITGNNTGGNSPIVIWNTMRVAVTASANTWVLGGHLDASNGVNCVTCHAVHGVDADAATPSALLNDPPNANFLTISQTGGNWDGGRTVANGAGDYNPLCEGCHVGDGTQLVATYGMGTIDSRQGAITDTPMWGNPGGTAYTHPVDDMDVEAGKQWVPNGAAFPSSGAPWPVGGFGAVGAASNPNVICESCHIVHPQANVQGTVRADNVSGAVSDYILRNSSAKICGGCHTASVNGHHPTNLTYNSSGVPYLNVTGGAGDILSCGTCHGGGTGAHNWPSRGYVGLDPQWKPFNNARGDADAYAYSQSMTCIECHSAADGNAANLSPTMHDGYNAVYSSIIPGMAAETAVSYPSRGLANVDYSGSHYMGLLGLRPTYGADYWQAAKLNAIDPTGAAFNPETTSWAPAFPGAKTGARSRFAGVAGSPVLVCESCHELEPALTSPTHLLLASYVEEEVPANVAPFNGRSRFCEGCHMPPGTHPQTGNTVGRSNGDVLNTDPTSTTSAGNVRNWLDDPNAGAAPNDANVRMPIANDVVNCDSCHTPHEGPRAAGTFIIDSVFTAIGNGGVSTNPGLRAMPGASWVNAYVPSTYTGRGNAHNVFCSTCHPY